MDAGIEFIGQYTDMWGFGEIAVLPGDIVDFKIAGNIPFPPTPGMEFDFFDIRKNNKFDTGMGQAKIWRQRFLGLLLGGILLPVRRHRSISRLRFYLK